MTVALTKVETQVVWRSSDAGNKTVSIPGSVAGNKGYDLDITTTLGTGETYTVTPTSGTIDGNPSYSFTDDQCTLSLRSDADNADWIIRCFCCRLNPVNPAACTWTWTDLTNANGGIAAQYLNGTISADGTKLSVLNTSDGTVWTSADSGVTWSNITPSGFVLSSAGGFVGDATGQKLVLGSGVFPPAPLYISINQGVSWSTVSFVDSLTGDPKTRHFVAGSANGQIYAVGTSAFGNIQQSVWLSFNGGASWIQQLNLGYPGPGSASWQTFMSSDGAVIFATNTHNNGYITRNGGATWTLMTYPFAVATLAWGISASLNGAIIIASPFATAPSSPVDYLYKSSDFGVTWTPMTGASQRVWSAATAISDNGQIMIAAVGTQAFPLGVTISCDGGVTWHDQAHPGGFVPLMGLSITQAGRQIIGVPHGPSNAFPQTAIIN